jgi:hypothetical protein
LFNETISVLSFLYYFLDSLNVSFVTVKLL